MKHTSVKYAMHLGIHLYLCVMFSVSHYYTLRSNYLALHTRYIQSQSASKVLSRLMYFIGRIIMQSSSYFPTSLPAYRRAPSLSL